MRKLKKKFCVAMLIFLMFMMSGCTAKIEQNVDSVSDRYSGVVSYLGPEGTYTEEAVKQFFGENGDYRPQKTVADALQQMLDGESTYAVIPQENTIGGPVYDYVDELLSCEDVHIIGEVELPIRQALLTAPGSDLDGITTVYSHKQGIIQSQAWLSENLPQAEIVEVSSTAEGAKMVAESGAKNLAAIASKGAAEVYGLTILAENIQQNEDNQTRFYVLAAGSADLSAEGERMVFSATGAADGLPELLKQMDKENMTLISIHDRPEKTRLGQYIYLIECENRGWNAYQRVSKLDAFSFRYYGAFSTQ